MIEEETSSAEAQLVSNKSFRLKLDSGRNSTAIFI
jgi:hypothetical protein